MFCFKQTILISSFKLFQLGLKYITTELYEILFFVQNQKFVKIIFVCMSGTGAFKPTETCNVISHD